MKVPIRPLQNKIFFQFEDKIIVNSQGKRSFESIKDGGIVLMGEMEDTAKTARWATVIGVGPKVDDGIVVGSRIAIEPLRWTEMITVGGVDFWQTNDEEVLIVEK